MDAYTAPETTHSGPRPASIRARVLAVFCLILGILGTLMTCFSAFSVIWSQVAPSFMDPAQAEVMRVIHAQQGWWVLPFSLLQLLAKMTLSVGLIAGSTLVIAHKPSGPNLLRPVLIYGIILELGVGLLGVGYAAFNFTTMADQFGEAMAATPDLPPNFNESTGPIFGTMMVVGMLMMLGWAVIKAALYTATWYSLRVSQAD